MTESKPTDFGAWAWETAAMLRFLRTHWGECLGDHQDWIDRIDVILADERALSMPFHPEAQGNKDLGEPAASGLEVRDGLNAIAWYLDRWLSSTVERDYPDRAQMPENPTFLSLEADCHYNQIRHWITKLREFALQAQREAQAAPTSPQPIKGESELESASNGMGLR